MMLLSGICLNKENTMSQEFEGENTLDIKNTDGIYPNATVKISKIQYSVFELKRKYESPQRQDIVLDPDFQRGSVWTKKKQKSELIESILMGIPIPIIYLFETKDGKKEVVDGRQRITTLIDFMNDGFLLAELRMLPKLNGSKFSELDPLLQSTIEDYQIMAYVIQPPTPERVKFDIFDRVNRGGTQLNNQEMRNALYQGDATKLLQEMSKFSEFKKATGNSIKSTRMKDRYIILRFIGFYLLRTGKLDTEYKSNIDDFLAFVMEYLNSSDTDIMEHLKDIFKKSMSLSYELFGGDGFRFETFNQNKRPINMPLFESLGYFYSMVCKNLDKNVLKNEIEKLKKEFDESDKFTNSVDSSTNVNYRFEKVIELKEKLC